MKRRVCFFICFLLILSALPVAAWEEIPWEPEDILYGDVNQSSIINAKDALTLLQYTVGKGELATQSPTDVLPYGDLNQDGRIDGLDALEILKFLVKKPVSFPNTLLVRGTHTLWLGTQFLEDYTTVNRESYDRAFGGLQTKTGIGTYVSELDSKVVDYWIERQTKAGMNAYHLLEVSPATALKLAKQKALANLGESKTLNLAKFSNMATGHMTFGNRLYGVAPVSTANDPYVLFYHKEYLAEMAPELNLPALVEEQKWTTDILYQALPKQRDLVNQYGETVEYRGFTAVENSSIPLICAVGGSPFGFWEEGKVSVANLHERLTNGLLFARDLFKNSYQNGWAGTSQKAWNVFSQGKVMFFLAPVSRMDFIVEQVPFEVGIAPVPLERENALYTTVHANPRVYVVPANRGEELEEIGLWLNELGQNSGKYINNVAKKMVVATGDSANWYTRLMKNQQWDYCANAHGKDDMNVPDYIEPAVTTSHIHKPFQEINAYAQRVMDEFYGPLYECE